MFYKIQVRDHTRVTPDAFNMPLDQAVIKMVKAKYDGFISQDFGIVIDVISVEDIGEGVILPGDGSTFYDTTFSLLAFKPEMQEVVTGRIKDIEDFGAFITLGPIEGMIHVGQCMDDFVSFSKDKVLLGRDSKRSLKVGDVCKARIIAVSFKDMRSPKIGLTMRQAGLGKLEWISDDLKPKEAKKEEKKEKKVKKEKK